MPELSGVIGAAEVPAIPVEEQEAVEESVPEQEPVVQEESPSEADSEAEGEQAEAEPEAVEEPEEPEAPDIPEQPVLGTPIEQSYVQPCTQFQPQYVQAQQSVQPECPPTNLVWAILTTVLCCLPLGIIAILYAVKVSSRYNAGDYAGAERASETGAWWCIGAIIAGIVLSPLLSLLPMLIQM